MNEQYQLIMKELQAKFPEGTVVNDVNKKRAYIPAQVYIKRLEDVAGDAWSWRLVSEPTYKDTANIMEVRGELSILGATRSGIGFSHYIQSENSKSSSTYKNAVNSAESDAIRNACDKYLMGWKDLAPHREWASNPGVNLIEAVVETTKESKTCVRCLKPLSSEDFLVLELHKITLNYCSEHIPKHFLKNTLEEG